MFRLILATVLIVVVGSASAHANFIEDWSLTTSINPGNADIASARFSNPMNPFSQTHSVNVLGSTSMTTYEFLWGPAGGVFDIAASIELAAVPGLNRRAMTTGLIYINSPVPLLVSGVSQWDYNLTRDPMIATMALGISRFDPPQDIAGELVSYSTAINGPQSGVLNTDFQDVLIPPNDTYTLIYSFTISNNAGISSAAVATGTGFVHFEIIAIPEPMTVCFMGLAATVFVARRARRDG